MRPRTRGRRTRALPGKAATAAICAFSALGFFAAGAQAAAPAIERTHVTHVTATSAVLEAKINPNGAATEYHFEYGTAPCPSASCLSVPVPDGKIPPEGSPDPPGTSPVEVKAPVEGLQPSTVYHYRVVAKNPAIAEGPDRLFATYGQTFEGLPDGRAYEQASPVDKNGGDAQGQEAIVKASPNGDGIVFGSNFGIPGGKGVGGLPTYLATRGASNWSTVGLLPPPSVGEQSQRDRPLAGLLAYLLPGRPASDPPSGSPGRAVGQRRPGHRDRPLRGRGTRLLRRGNGRRLGRLLRSQGQAAAQRRRHPDRRGDRRHLQPLRLGPRKRRSPPRRHLQPGRRRPQRLLCRPL